MNLKNLFNKVQMAALALAVGIISTLPARATDPDLFTDATTAVTDNKAKLVTFLGVAILVPIAFYVYALVKKVIGKAK